MHSEVCMTKDNLVRVIVLFIVTVAAVGGSYVNLSTVWVSAHYSLYNIVVGWCHA